MAAAKVKAESVFSLESKGAVPAILRAMADAIDTGDAKAESFASRSEASKYELHVVLNTNPQG